MSYTTQSSDVNTQIKKEEKKKSVGDHASEFLGNMSSKFGSIGSMFSSTPTPAPAPAPTPTSVPTPAPTVRGGRKTRRGKSRKCTKCTKSRKCARCNKTKKSRKCARCTRSRKCAMHRKSRKN
ncbi:hypothetical protein N8261_05195 [Flavobacteriaceae bacterium]|nr:hypothetical protein [Flavobacteriaceae bacterium]